MMTGVLEKKIAPPHSVVFVADPSRQYQVPADPGAALVTFTRSCITVGTLAEMDGETLIKLGAEIAFPEGRLVFDGELETPGRKVAVVDSNSDIIVSINVNSDTARVKIWVNDPSEPDLILVQATVPSENPFGTSGAL